MNLRKWFRCTLKMREACCVISDRLGWRHSFIEGRPLDAEGKPIPWYTYPAIEFIRSLILDDCRVFEYGSGNSSAFWASRVSEVTAVENDPQWANEVRSMNIANLTVITSEDKSTYTQAPLSTAKKFDIVIIDGRYRKDCAEVATNVISNEGMIIFDNADWYPDACEFIRSRGWFQVDFSGLGPINPYAWTTSIFIKADIKIKHVSKFSPIGGNPAGLST